MEQNRVNGKTIIKFALNYGIYIFLLVACLILALTTDSFLTKTNLVNILLQTSIIATMAIGVTFVLITGNNDLSMGSVMAVASAVGIASILQSARMNSFWAAMGTGLEFQAIAGAIIGGTSMSGGVGKLAGTFAGVMLMGVINNALNLYGVDANWQEAARGFVILIAIVVDAIRQRYSTVE